MPDSQNTTGDTPVGGQGFPADNHRTGEPGLIGKDDFTREYEIGRLNRGRQEVLTGNYADLQRIGALLADNKATAGVAANPVIDPKSDTVLTPAQHDAAKGEWTVESERAGLVEAPSPPTPADNTQPNSVDPSSVSPTVQSKSSIQSSTPQSATKKG